MCEKKNYSEHCANQKNPPSTVSETTREGPTGGDGAGVAVVKDNPDGVNGLPFCLTLLSSCTTTAPFGLSFWFSFSLGSEPLASTASAAPVAPPFFFFALFPLRAFRFVPEITGESPLSSPSPSRSLSSPSSPASGGSGGSFLVTITWGDGGDSIGSSTAVCTGSIDSGLCSTTALDIAKAGLGGNARLPRNF